MELASWRAEQRSQSQREREVFPPNDRLAVEYLTYLETQRGRSPQTLGPYKSTRGAWLDWLGPQHLYCAERAEMERFMERKRKRRGAGRMGSPATRRREASCLRAFYRWLADVDTGD